VVGWANKRAARSLLTALLACCLPLGFEALAGALAIFRRLVPIRYDEGGDWWRCLTSSTLRQLVLSLSGLPVTLPRKGAIEIASEP